MATTAKHIARELIEQLPGNASWEDILYALYVRQQIASARCSPGPTMNASATASFRASALSTPSTRSTTPSTSWRSSMCGRILQAW